MTVTILGLPVVSLLERSEVNKVYDALDWWRDFYVHRRRLSLDDRAEMLARHGEFARGVRTGMEGL